MTTGRSTYGPNENARATDVYILRGGRPGGPRASLHYQCFRYVEMTGFREPGPGAARGLFRPLRRPRTGELRASNALVNAIHANTVWASSRTS